MSTNCLLCRGSEKDDLKYGEFMVKKDVAVHYYCLLLTSNLVQSGDDQQGFLGFLAQDIKSESKRVRNLVCCYCRKRSANIACCHSKCQRTFHLRCGIEEGCVNQFLNTFRSFCDKHNIYEKRIRPPLDEICSICYDSLGSFKRHLVFRAPCCKSGWFHRWCLAKMALNAGYFFKCPLCNNKEQFRDYFLRRSIFVPDQDAAWEFEPDAFAELLERPDTCAAEKCKCPHGRQHDSRNYELLICNICGSKAQHKACITGKKEPTTFACKDCEEFTQTKNNTRSSSAAYIDETDDEIDVDVERIIKPEGDSKAEEENTRAASDDENEHSKSIPENKIKGSEDLEMPVLSPYKVPAMEEFSSYFSKNKRRRSDDFDMFSSHSDENNGCKLFKVISLCDDSDDSCASDSGTSRSSAKSVSKIIELTPLTDAKERTLNTPSTTKSLSVEFIGEGDYFADDKSVNNSSLSLQRRNSESSLSPDYSPERQRVTRSLSTGSEYVRNNRFNVRRSARIRQASLERFSPYSDSGLFSSNSSDGESSFARRRSFFTVVERFKGSPSLQSTLLKYNFKSTRRVKFSY